MKEKVSIIVTVFNVSQFIGECARSLFELDYPLVEYIFVNDCSTDDSMSVLQSVVDEYPDRRPLMKVLSNKENRGPGASRKIGAEHATGEYVIFIDSDDWMEADMIASMVETMEKYHSDAVVCDYFSDNAPVASLLDESETANCKESFFRKAVAADGMFSLWRIMFRRTVLDAPVVWALGFQREDLAMLLQFSHRCNDIRYLHRPLYHWRQRESSLTHAPSPDKVISKFMDCIDSTLIIEHFLESVGLKENYYDELVCLKLSCRFMLLPLLRMGKCLAEWRSAFPEINGHVLFNHLIKTSHKFEFILVSYCTPGIVKNVYSLVGKIKHI